MAGDILLLGEALDRQTDIMERVFREFCASLG